MINEELILKCIELEEAFALEQTGKREDAIVAGVRWSLACIVAACACKRPR